MVSTVWHSSGDNKFSDGIIHDTLESLQEHEQTSLCVYTKSYLIIELSLILTHTE